jgi:hypothetical protein
VEEEEGMAATTSQGKSFALFIAGLTAAAAGVAFVTSSMGKLDLVVGIAALAVAFIAFFKIKGFEGETAATAQPMLLKMGGVCVAVLGWLIVLIGLHLTASVGGRMTTTVIGLIVSLVGTIGILPIAASKNAIWKA